MIFNNEQKQVHIKSWSLSAKWNIFSFYSQFKDSNFIEELKDSEGFLLILLIALSISLQIDVNLATKLTI